jgi:hypothetical protein
LLATSGSFYLAINNSFYQPLLGELKQSNLLIDKEIANQKVLTWLEQVANQRLHGTINQRPCERLIIEQPMLQLLAYPYQGMTVSATEKKSNNQSRHRCELAAISLQHELSIYDDLSFDSLGVH